MYNQDKNYPLINLKFKLFLAKVLHFILSFRFLLFVLYVYYVLFSLLEGIPYLFKFYSNYIHNVFYQIILSFLSVGSTYIVLYHLVVNLFDDSNYDKNQIRIKILKDKIIEGNNRRIIEDSQEKVSNVMETEIENLKKIELFSENENKILSSPIIIKQENKVIESTPEIIPKTTQLPSPINLTKASKPNTVISNLDELFISKQSPKIKNLIRKSFPKRALKSYLESMQKNQNIGLAGELFVMEYEKELLKELNRSDLASKIKHVSLESDLLGYDIVSYNKNGHEKWVEVKTSTQGYNTDFFLSENEMLTMERLYNYQIYRVFNFDLETRTGDIYIVDGRNTFKENFFVRPTMYRVTPKKK